MEPLPSPIHRSLVTAVALGAHRTVTLNLAAQRYLTHSRKITSTYSSDTPKSIDQFASPMGELRVSSKSSPLLRDVFSFWPVPKSRGIKLRVCLTLRKLIDSGKIFLRPNRVHLVEGFSPPACVTTALLKD
ncbi:hypothetical protein ARMGADRAFT_196265 [Armillaria gallica]|uniref:Uncharacterized protein n=1 Tax=Armillaria gallica TaxID=47427 RepID=A0A2H3CSN8_ARMGA|nr:hypothetical protein ARMGADRAFT_196265 [Armillaria gallica]